MGNNFPPISDTPFDSLKDKPFQKWGLLSKEKYFLGGWGVGWGGEDTFFKPIALRTAKIPKRFDRSERNSVKSCTL